MLSTFLGRFPCLIMGVRQCKRQRAQVLPAQQGLRVWVCPVPKSPSAMGTTTRKQSYSAGVRALRLAILFTTPARSLRSSNFLLLLLVFLSLPRAFSISFWSNRLRYTTAHDGLARQRRRDRFTTRFWFPVLALATTVRTFPAAFRFRSFARGQFFDLVSHLSPFLRVRLCHSCALWGCVCSDSRDRPII